jgi:ethanolamine utilization protein EutN
MRVAEVIGTVTLGRCHPSFERACLKLAVPLSLDCLARSQPSLDESIVVWDELGAGQGSRIAVSEGAEAAQPFRPELKTVDDYNASLLDDVSLKITKL